MDCHECTCFQRPPCSACEHCTHYDGQGENCESDCQDCEEHNV